MEELLRFLRAQRGQSAPRVNPGSLDPRLAPKTFSDTLRALVGEFDVRESQIPALSGASGQVADLPGTRRRIMVDPSAAGNRDVLAHEAGHVLDFADTQGRKLREELGVDAEEFAELFSGAVLDPRLRGPVSPKKQRMIDFIDKRLDDFVSRRQQALSASQDATRVRR